MTFGLSLGLSWRTDEGIGILRELVHDGAATANTRGDLALVYGLSGRDREASATLAADLTSSQIQNNLGYYRSLREMFRQGKPIRRSRSADRQPAAQPEHCAAGPVAPESAFDAARGGTELGGCAATLGTAGAEAGGGNCSRAIAVAPTLPSRRAPEAAMAAAKPVAPTQPLASPMPTRSNTAVVGSGDYWFMLMKLSRISSTAGPIKTMKSAGGVEDHHRHRHRRRKRPAFSSARNMRSVRCSWLSTLNARASGVPYFSAWIIVLVNASIEGEGARFSEVFQGAPVGHEAEFECSLVQFVAQHRGLATGFRHNALKRGVGRSPGFGADHQHVERVGQRLAHALSRLERAFLMTRSGAFLPQVGAAAAHGGSISAAPLPIGSGP